MKDSNYIFFGWWMWDSRTKGGYEYGFPQFNDEDDCPVTKETAEGWEAIKLYKIID